MAQTPECIAYLNAKQNYVERLNTVIATQSNILDVLKNNNFDRADKSISKSVVRALSESSKNLERVFFSDRIDDAGRTDIVNAIFLHPNRDTYDTYVRTSDSEFLLIRKYDLPFIRDFLKMDLIRSGNVGKHGFEALTKQNESLFNEILEIDGDKFVLHSGVKPGGFGGDRAQHCPLIVSLIRLMDQHHIPFDSRRPVVQHCIKQHETEFDFATVSDGDDVEYVTRLEDDDEASSAAPPSAASSRVASRVAPSAAPSPEDQLFIAAQATHPNILALNKIGDTSTLITQPRGLGGRRTKKHKLSKRMTRRTRRIRRTRRKRNSLRKH